MGNVTVQRTSDGFIVTRGADTITVTDTNQNGRIDNADVWNMAGKTPLTEEERWEAMGLSLAKDDMTTQEMSQYEAFLKQREARENYKETQAANQNKKTKGKFWNKLATATQTILPFMPIVSGLVGVLGSFSLNRNAADNAIRMSTIMNATQMGMNTIAMFGALNNTKNNNYVATNALNINNGFATGFDLNSGISSDFSGLIQNAVAMTNIQMAKQAETIAKAQETTIMNNAKNKVEQLLQYNSEGKITLCDVNKAFLEELQDLDGEKTYSQDDIAYINQIISTPRIPIQHINLQKTEDETKITKEFAGRLEALLKKYDDANGDLKYDVMTEEEYETIKGALEQPKLTKAQIDALKEMYTEITTRKKDENDTEE